MQCRRLYPFFLAVMFVCVPAGPPGCGEYCSKYDNAACQSLELKRACLEAARQAIELEVGRLPEIQESVLDNEDWFIRFRGQMLQDRDRFNGMCAEDFPLPEPVELEATADEDPDFLATFKGQARKGPYYHVISSRKPITLGKKYKVTLYPVYFMWTNDGCLHVYTYVNKLK